MLAKKIQFGEFNLWILYQVIDIQISRNHICHNQWKIIIVQTIRHFVNEIFNSQLCMHEHKLRTLILKNYYLLQLGILKIFLTTRDFIISINSFSTWNWLFTFNCKCKTFFKSNKAKPCLVFLQISFKSSQMKHHYSNVNFNAIEKNMFFWKWVEKTTPNEMKINEFVKSRENKNYLKTKKIIST